MDTIKKNKPHAKGYAQTDSDLTVGDKKTIQDIKDNDTFELFLYFNFKHLKKENAIKTETALLSICNMFNEKYLFKKP